MVGSYNQKLLMVKWKRRRTLGVICFDFNPAANKAKEYATMSDSTTNPQVLPLPQSRDVLTALLREGAQRMLTQAIEAEVADWIGAHANHGDRLQIGQAHVELD